MKNIFIYSIFSLGIVPICTAGTMDQTFTNTEGKVQQTFGENSAINTDIDKNRNTNNSRIDNANSVIINIEANRNDIVHRLPESKRRTAEKLSDIAIDLVKASTTDNNDKFKNRVAQKISDVTLLDYQASSNPFLPPINKTQLMCNNQFIFAYRGDHYKNNDQITYIINNSAYNAYPGNSKLHEKDNAKLDILYLEYDKENNTPILHYTCNK